MSSFKMGILFTILMGFLFTITIGKLFTIAVGIQLTISRDIAIYYIKSSYVVCHNIKYSFFISYSTY